MEGVVESVEQSQDSQRENGGHAMIGEEFVVHWDEGGEPNSSDNISRMSIKPFKVNGITRIPNNVGNVAFYWHIHPNCNIQGDNSFGSSNRLTRILNINAICNNQDIKVMLLLLVSIRVK